MTSAPIAAMSEQAVIPVERRRNAPVIVPAHRISGKVRAAIDAMVWDGLPRNKAAAKAGISDHGLYKALRSPPVKSYYLGELEVLRTSERARNLHRLTEIRDAANNMPAVQAIKTLEQISDDPAVRSPSAPAVPGVVIVIADRAAVMGRDGAIEAKPLIINEAGRDDE